MKIVRRRKTARKYDIEFLSAQKKLNDFQNRAETIGVTGNGGGNGLETDR
jgi:hypothetical protein